MGSENHSTQKLAHPTPTSSRYHRSIWWQARCVSNASVIRFPASSKRRPSQQLTRRSDAGRNFFLSLQLDDELVRCEQCAVLYVAEVKKRTIGSCRSADDSSFARSNFVGHGYFCVCQDLFFFLGECRTGAATLLVSSQICNVQKSWCSEERCTAVLFGPVMVVNVFAPIQPGASRDTRGSCRS